MQGATLSDYEEKALGFATNDTIHHKHLPLIVGVTIGVLLLVAGLCAALYCFCGKLTSSTTTKRSASGSHCKGHRPGSSASKRSKHSKRSKRSKRSAKAPSLRLVVKSAPQQPPPPSMLDARFGHMDSQLYLNVDVEDPTGSDLDLEKFVAHLVHGQLQQKAKVQQQQEPLKRNHRTGSPKRTKSAAKGVVALGVGKRSKSNGKILQKKSRSRSAGTKTACLKGRSQSSTTIRSDNKP